MLHRHIAALWSLTDPIRDDLQGVTNGQSGGLQRAVGVADAGLTEMEYGGGEHCICMPLAHARDKMIERTDAARGDHRHRDRIGNRAGQIEVIADLRPVAVHRSDKQFARAEFDEAVRAEGLEPNAAAARALERAAAAVRKGRVAG